MRGPVRVDLVIRGGLLADEHGVRPAGLAIHDGRVVAVGEDSALPPAADELDASGLVVLPGLVDPHVHFRDPNPAEEEDFATGTMSAAAGGVTCVAEQPVDLPPTIDAASWDEKRASVALKAYVDYALWGGLVDDNLAHLPELEARGAIAYKAFLCRSDPVYPMVDDGLVLRALEWLAPRDTLVGFHAENDAIIRRRTEALRTAGRTDARAHGEARPELAEVEAAARAIRLAEATGARVHLLHTSSAQVAREVQLARVRGVRVTAETCPHYLVLDESALDAAGPYAKCNPPLRSRETVEALWQALAPGGGIQMIVSDHSPYTTAAKQRGFADIWAAPPGINALQLGLPLLVDAGVRTGRLSWPDLVRLLAANPSRLLGLYPTKGALAPGSDADVVLVDPEQEWQIKGEDLYCKNRWTPYEGRHLTGRVVATLVRGRCVYRDAGSDPFPAGPGYGRFSTAGKRGLLDPAGAA